jgi:hypothetical protein
MRTAGRAAGRRILLPRCYGRAHPGTERLIHNEVTVFAVSCAFAFCYLLDFVIVVIGMQGLQLGRGFADCGLTVSMATLPAARAKAMIFSMALACGPFAA